MNRCALSIVLAATLAGAAPVRAGTCALPLVASLELKALGDGEYMVPVTIAGVSHDFLLGLDNPLSAISGAFADAQGFKSRAVPYALVPSVDGETIKQVVTLPDVTVGAARVTGFRMLRKDRALQGPASAALGLLGLDLLRNFDVELDLKNRRLKLFTPNDCGDGVVYWQAANFAKVSLKTDASGHGSFPMKLDGASLDVDFYIQDRPARMGTSTFEALFGLTPQSPGVTAEQQDGDTIYHYPFRTLSLEGIAIANPRIDIFPDGGVDCRPDPQLAGGGRGKRCFGASQLRLFNPVLSALHLYIAFKQKTAYVTAAGAP